MTCNYLVKATIKRLLQQFWNFGHSSINEKRVASGEY